MYKICNRVRFSEIGEDGKLTLHHLINYFQDCSTFHLEDIGLGADYFMNQRLAFYMLSWQIEINRLPVLGEEIKVGTLIYDCKGMFGYRNYALYDKNDEVLAYANLCGCFLNPTSGEFTKLTEEEISKYPIKQKLEMTYMPRKIKAPKSVDYLEAIKISQFQIDTNGHVNNSQYVAMASEYLPSDFEAKRVRVEYKKAVKRGECLIPSVIKQDEIYFITLCDESLKPCVIMSFE